MTTRYTARTLLIVASALTIWAVPSHAQDATSRVARSRSGNLFQNNAAQASDWLAQSSRTPSQWHLGIEGQATTTGFSITSVEPRSAAERAQLQRGDVIVNVGGYQVGMVGPQVYAVDDEINRLASYDGRVSMLVQDGRTGRLASLQVQLVARDDFITVETVFDRTARLPADAVLTVNLENLSRPHFRPHTQNNTFPATSVANRTIQLPYDRQYIYADDIYAVRATVTSQGRTVLETITPQRVITRNSPSSVRLELVPLERYVTARDPGAVTASFQNEIDVDRVIAQTYQKYYGRPPNIMEQLAWRQHADQLDSMPTELMASQEFFDRTGNNSQVWVQAVFNDIVGKPPTQSELNQWLVHLASLRNSRTAMLNHLQEAARGTSRR